MDRNRLLIIAGFLVATIATLGSLAYSNIMGFAPCRLCWYQRILMYPLVPLLGYIAYTNRQAVAVLALFYTIPGIGIATYHSYLQIAQSGTCGFGGCGTVYTRIFYLSIPNQSLVAFLLITTGILALGHENTESQ